MGIGNILQNLLDNNDTTAVEVSRATGVAPTTIYSIIKRDSKSANISDLAKIAHHLGVTLDYFYEGEANNNNISLSSHEKAVITAYRNQPAMQEAVDRLLGVQEEKIVAFKAARGEDNNPPEYAEFTKEQLDKLKKAPEFDGDL